MAKYLINPVYAYKEIKDNFIPANGEVVLVDTKNGLRPKIGNGKLSYSKLHG